MDSQGYETFGLAFETPPLDTIYTRALTFIKAWETENYEGIQSLCTTGVELAVPLYAKEVSGLESVVSYRQSLGGMLGMMTVDSVRVSARKFESYLHEYGIEPGQVRKRDARERRPARH